MAGLHSEYLTTCHDRTGYHANWRALSPRKLGDVGTLGPDYQFQQFDTLENLGVQYATRQGAAKGVEKFSSERGYEFRLAFDDGTGTTTVNLSFGRARRFTYEAKDITYSSITNLADIERQIIDLLATGRWRENFVVITEIGRAESFTLIVANSRRAAIEFELEGDKRSGFSLADRTLGLEGGITMKRDLAYELIAQGPTDAFLSYVAVAPRYNAITDDPTKNDLQLRRLQSEIYHTLADDGPE